MKKIFLLIIFLAMFIVGCTSAETTPTIRVTRIKAPTPEPASSSSFKQFSAQLYCPECQDAGMKINVWKTPSREGLKTVGSYPHGTTVTVIGNEAGHYKIKKGNVIGYVSTQMIKK